MTWWKPSTWKKSPSPASSVPSTGTKVYTSSEAKSLTPSQKASSTIVSSTASASSGTPTGSVSSYINKKSGGSSSGGSSSSNGTTYSGPVQEGTSAETFRDTGTTIQNMSIDKTKARTITPSTTTTIQQVSINPQTGRPYGTITEAPKNLWKKEVKNKGYVAGTLFYAGQKASGWFSSSPYSPVIDSGYQEPVGTLASRTIDTGSYFVPYAGQVLMVGATAENVLTPSGRTRISQTSEYLEKEKGWNPKITTPAIYGVNIGVGALGLIGVKGNLNKIFRVPKTESTILGTSQQVVENKVITNVISETQVKKLFGREKNIGLSSTTTDITQLPSGKYSIGDSVTFGSFMKPKLNVVKWEWKVGKIKEFNVIQRDFSKPFGEQSSVSLGYGKGSVGKDITGFKPKIKKFNFIGEGGSFKFNEDISIFAGRSRLFDEGKLLRQGSGTQTGVIIKKPLPGTTSFGSSIIQGSSSGGTSLSETFTKIPFQKEIIKSTQATSSAISSFKRTSPFGIKIPTLSLSNPTKIKQIITYSPQVEKVKEVQITTPVVIQAPATKTRTRSFNSVKQITPLAVDTAIKSKVTLAITPALKSKAITLQTSKFKTPQMIIAPRITPTPFPVFPLFALPPFGERTGLGGSLKSRRTYSYTPSFSALAFGIKGKGFAPAPTTKFTGLELRPIYKKKKKNLMFFPFSIPKKKKKKKK